MRQVILGDSRLVLPTFRPDSSWAMVTDPPYGIRYKPRRTGGRGRTNGEAPSWSCRVMSGDEDIGLREMAIAWAKSHGMPWACFGTWKTPVPSGVRGVLVWDKGPAYGMGDLSFPWKPNWEMIYVGGKGWRGSRGNSVLAGKNVSTNRSGGRTHPTEKPVSLLLQLMAKLPDHSVIVDPFAGTGSCGVAAGKAGKSFIGIEIDPGYHGIAKDRISKAIQGEFLSTFV